MHRIARITGNVRARSTQSAKPEALKWQSLNRSKLAAQRIHRGGQLRLRLLLRMTRSDTQHGSSVTSCGYLLQGGTVTAWTCSARNHPSAVLKQVIERKQRLT